MAKVEPYNHNTASYTFELPPGTDSGLSVASALVVKAAEEGGCVDDKGKPVIRPYTPVTAPNVEGKLELLIKRYEGGKMSQHIHGLKPGQSLAIKGPIPKFQYKANEFDEVAFIAGGSGITPMWQVMQHIDANPSDKTKATLIFSNVTEQDILLRERFDDLAKRKPDQFKIVYTLDKPPSGWQGATGYVSQDLVAKHVPLPAHGDKIKVFVCGPPGQMKARTYRRLLLLAACENGADTASNSVWAKGQPVGPRRAQGLARRHGLHREAGLQVLTKHAHALARDIDHPLSRKGARTQD